MSDPRQLRRAHLQYLSQGATEEADPIAYLARVCQAAPDNDEQVAAIQGLLRYREQSASLLPLARRLCDRQRPYVVRYLIRSLERLAREGGLLLWGIGYRTNPHINEEYAFVLDRLVRAGRLEMPTWTGEPGSRTFYLVAEGELRAVQFLLGESPDPDFRAGLILGVAYGPNAEGEPGTGPPVGGPEGVSWAEHLADQRVPGLVELLKGERWARNSF
jgi:hypothetical protein